MISTPCHSYLQSFLEGTLQNAAKNPVFFSVNNESDTHFIADLHIISESRYIRLIQLCLNTFNMAFIKFLNFI